MTERNHLKKSYLVLGMFDKKNNELMPQTHLLVVDTLARGVYSFVNFCAMFPSDEVVLKSVSCDLMGHIIPVSELSDDVDFVEVDFKDVPTFIDVFTDNDLAYIGVTKELFYKTYKKALVEIEKFKNMVEDLKGGIQNGKAD